MKYLTTIPYDTVDFLFIENHYDIHWSGLCIDQEHGVCRFKTFDHPICGNLFCDQHDGDDELAECTCPEYPEVLMCDIYRLNIFEKMVELTKKKLFELCVGYHWTYENGRLDRRFEKSHRDLSFRIYYWLRRK